MESPLLELAVLAKHRAHLQSGPHAQGGGMKAVDMSTAWRRSSMLGAAADVLLQQLLPGSFAGVGGRGWRQVSDGQEQVFESHSLSLQPDSVCLGESGGRRVQQMQEPVLRHPQGFIKLERESVELLLGVNASPSDWASWMLGKLHDCSLLPGRIGGRTLSS